MKEILNNLVVASQKKQRKKVEENILSILEKNLPLGVSWLGVARLAVLSGWYYLARECLQRAIISPQDRKSYLMKWSIMADCVALEHLIDEIELYKKAQGTNIAIEHFLGTLKTQIGDITSAKRLFESILAKNEMLGESWLTYITLFDRQAKPLLIEKMEQIKNRIDNSSVDWRSKSAFYNGLARLYENQQNYKVAFQYFLQSNRYLDKIAKYSPLEDEQVTNNLVSFDYESIELNSKISIKPNDKKIVFIIGSPRSGTTLLESIVASQLNACNLGEINGFECIISEHINDRNWGSSPEDFNLLKDHAFIQTIRQDYLQFVQEKVNNDHFDFYIDKSLQLNRFLPIIYYAFPDAKVIHIQRNQEDVIFSCFKAHFSQGLLWSRNIADIKSFMAREKLLNEQMLEPFKHSDNFISITYEELANQDNEVLTKLANLFNLDSFKTVAIDKKIPVKTSSTVQVRGELHTKSIGFSQHYKSFIDC